MSAQQDLRQAIELMQDGRVAQAVDMLNRLVADAELDDKGRAAAFVWLAEAREDSAYKIGCLEQALEHDPDNQQIRQGLQQLLSARPQPTQLPAMGPARNRDALDSTPPVIGIVGGLNGPASGVFINSAGIVATTSYAIGSAAQVTVALDAELHLTGVVVRRFPTIDIALIDTGMRLSRVTAAAPPSMIAENSAFVALGYGGMKLRGALARLNRGRARHWLRTTIPPAQLPDAGGNPLYHEYGQLLGLMTRNVDGAGNALAITASQVQALAEGAGRDRRLMPEAMYCAACGSRSRARLYGGIHCETCGAAQRVADTEVAPSPQVDRLARLRGEGAGPPCGHCGAQVGNYDGRCLRCGQAIVSGALAEP